MLSIRKNINFCVKILFFSLTLLFSSSAFAETEVITPKITKISKKRRTVYIDQGKVNGFIKGEKVCFYSPAGKKVGCTKIRASNLNRSKLKLSRNLISSIRKDYKVELVKNSPESQEVIPSFLIKSVYLPTPAHGLNHCLN